MEGDCRIRDTFLGVFVFLLAGIGILPAGGSLILERNVRSCNGACSSVPLSCPADHKIALREAWFGLPRPPVCAPVNACSGSGTSAGCCESYPAQDCIYPYSRGLVTDLRRSCSGGSTCSFETTRVEDAPQACPNSDPRNSSSYTSLNYVCVNNSFVADFCSEKNSYVSGKAVFALFDPSSRKPLPAGSICSCTAHSSTLHNQDGARVITVFTVDMRLNRRGYPICSRAHVAMSSGGATFDVTCEGSMSELFPQPFVPVMNSTSVSLAQLMLMSDTPEFVWIGYEAAQGEVVHLSCSVESGHGHGSGPGQIPDSMKIGEMLAGSKNKESSSSNSPGGGDADEPDSSKRNASVGLATYVLVGILGGIVATIVIGLVVMSCRRKRRERRRRQKVLSAVIDGDVDPFYTYTNVSYLSDVSTLSSTCSAYSDGTFVPDPTALPKRSSLVRRSDIEGLYASPSEIRRKKKQTVRFSIEGEEMEPGTPKPTDAPPDLPPRNGSPEEVAEDGGENYVTAEEVRKRKHSSNQEEESEKTTTSSSSTKPEIASKNEYNIPWDTKQGLLSSLRGNKRLSRPFKDPRESNDSYCDPWDSRIPGFDSGVSSGSYSPADYDRLRQKPTSVKDVTATAYSRLGTIPEVLQSKPEKAKQNASDSKEQVEISADGEIFYAAVDVDDVTSDPASTQGGSDVTGGNDDPYESTESVKAP